MLIYDYRIFIVPLKTNILIQNPLKEYINKNKVAYTIYPDKTIKWGYSID